jgi:serine/threonine-protein kinase
MAQQGPEQLAGVHEGEILAGKYRVERILGIGGMGVVVAARHIELDNRVAIKFLLPLFLSNQEAVARFAREARAAVKIQNEHVARVTDVGTLPNGAPYMVMDYLEGEDLAAWLEQRGPLPVDQAVEFVLQACVAVADAHALGIVHRDLKPANLFCVRRTDGQLSIKVLDFGISKMADMTGLASGSVTRTSAMMGSPSYMAPEQMRSSKDVDGRTDIWALGVILFELIAGRPAFLAETVPAMAIKIATEPAPAIQNLRPDVPAGLEAILLKCLEKDRTRRYANVAELAVALLPFAPPRAKASVERIAGIIRAAGLSTSSLLPPSPNAVDPAVGAGIVPPLDRTATGTKARGGTFLGVGLAGAVVAAVVAAAAVSAVRWSAHRDGLHVAAAATPSVTPSQAQDPQQPASSPEGDAANALDPTPVVLAPATPSVPLALPQGVATTKTLPPRPNPTQPQPSGARHQVPPAPPPTRCDPPYYFDSKGNRVFKTECI